MMMFVKCLLVLLAGLIVLLVHESGHYICARIFGVKVKKLCFFFDSGGTFIFENHSNLVRFLVYGSGVFANYIMAFVVCFAWVNELAPLTSGTMKACKTIETVHELAVDLSVSYVEKPMSLIRPSTEADVHEGTTLFKEDPSLQDFYWLLLVLNVAMLIINLLPLPPLDGWQMLKAILEKYF